MQCFMEWLHIGQGLEWWQTIIVTTVLVRYFLPFKYTLQLETDNQCMNFYRIVVSPVVVYAQRNMAHMTNNAPEMARLQVGEISNLAKVQNCTNDIL